MFFLLTVLKLIFIIFVVASIRLYLKYKTQEAKIVCISSTYLKFYTARKTKLTTKNPSIQPTDNLSVIIFFILCLCLLSGFFPWILFLERDSPSKPSFLPVHCSFLFLGMAIIAGVVFVLFSYQVTYSQYVLAVGVGK